MRTLDYIDELTLLLENDIKYYKWLSKMDSCLFKLQTCYGHIRELQKTINEAVYNLPNDQKLDVNWNKLNKLSQEFTKCIPDGIRKEMQNDPLKSLLLEHQHFTYDLSQETNVRFKR
jgi:hypothetical protein